MFIHVVPTTSSPSRVGRYDVLFPLASGGMATVYLARKRGPRGFESRVALKLTHEHLREQPEFVTCLIQEAKLAARIRHPNVVQLLDVDDDEAGVFLVMEYVEGDSLAVIARRVAKAGGRIPMPIALRVLDDALTGLEAAHALKDDAGRPLGVVHRDFSPQNILVGIDGVARLTDFGIAKASDRAGLTRTGTIKGKTGYMSPQQAQAQPVDRRADVWSAGVVAWELLAGERLYPGNDTATLLSLVRSVPPRLRTVRPEIPDALDDAVAQALQPDPAGRLPTAEALRERLHAAFSELADRAEVGAYVKNLLGEEIAERRARADAMAAVVPDARASRPDTFAVTSERPPALSAAEISRHRATPQVVAAAFGATLALVVAGILLAGRAISSVRARAAAVPAASAAEETGAPVETLELVDPTPPSQTSTPSGASELRVSANAPIARVVINGRALTLRTAARELVVVLEEPEKEGELSLVATSADGRVAHMTVPAGARAATVTFRRAAQSAASAASASAAPAAAPAPAPSVPKLHPSPYTTSPP
jgi:serine/threonine-protein kinase